MSQPLRQLFLNTFPTPLGLTDNEHISMHIKQYETFGLGVVAGIRYALEQAQAAKHENSLG